ncbi:LOW QUALITY PROTEIN: hypothetical protein PHMEG_00021286 [Phytophthora megakarya]|uniref:Uncharacterized protein n=1 Tax=Phytophthora megakarya TaxID=4795 RepID=A0A225VM01_9STRA|nr:LOW QUALITY PROTEIN: hypothetical protein PHMEG_00021286 [Phytophthora megakarya]
MLLSSNGFWERCVEKLRHRCTPTGDTFRKVVATVKGCVKHAEKPVYLRVKEPVADVTDADVMEAVQARCCTLKNEFVPDVTSLFL